MTIPICIHVTMIKVVECELCRKEFQIDMKKYDELTKMTTKDCDYYLGVCPKCKEIVAVDVKKSGSAP